MTSDLQGLHPYSAYKPSGVLWLGDVPEHWDVRRGKVLLCPVDIRSKTGNEELLTVSAQRGVVPRKSANVTMFKAESYVGYKLCWPGDLVINSLWAWAHGLGVSQHHGIVSSAYGVYRPLSKVHHRFIHLLARSVPFQWELQVRSKGIWVSRLQLTDEEFLRAPFPLPPLDEQRAIVRYFDYVDRRIQRYISAKRKLIALLEEERQAIVNRAVTRGLDPNVRLKPSGVDWLGDVPEHWEVRRLGYLATKFGSGITPRGGATIYQESGVPFLRSQNVHFGGIRMRYVARIAPTLHKDLAGSHVQPGDVLLNITGASIGRVCAVPADLAEANVNQHVCIIRPKQEHVHSRILAAYLSTPMMQRQIQTEQSGASREGLTLQSIRTFKVVLPLLSEQAVIVKHLDKATADIDAAIARAHRQIDLIQEYRTRLIADVVTGKLDVREAAALLPEEEDEPNLIDDSSLFADDIDDEADDLDEPKEEWGVEYRPRASRLRRLSSCDLTREAGTA